MTTPLRATGPVPLVPLDQGPQTIEALITEAQALERTGRRPEARALYEQAFKQLDDPQQSTMAADLLRWVARTWQVDGDLEAALDCCEAALEVARRTDDEATVGLVLNQRAGILVSSGDLDGATQLYEEVRNRALIGGDGRLAAMTAQNLGVIASIRGDIPRALRHYEASLGDYRRMGLAKDVCIALNNLGMLLTQTGQWDAAARAYEEAVEIGTALGDLSAVTLIEINRATLLVARDDRSGARAALDRALALTAQTGDAHTHAELYKVYGVVEREDRNFAQADNYFERAQWLAGERQDVLLQAEVSRERAEMYRRQGRNRDTLTCLNFAYARFAQLRATHMVADVDRRTSALEQEFLDVVRRWSDSIESKDEYTQGHCERVADIACALAAKTGMDDRQLFGFRIGALLHDVGKLMIPGEILNKPGRLDDSEWELVRSHPLAGVQMLGDIDFPWDVRGAVESHHERWDGAGYPRQLAGEDIPLWGRILCIADVYDALTTERSYKRALSHDEAMATMRKDSGRQFDPGLYALFEEVMREMAPQFANAPPPAPVVQEVPEAQRDDLTGVALRRAFVDRASHAISNRAGAAVSLIVIDIDHFKLVNDTYGHLQGDDLLRAVALLLNTSAPPGSLVGRYAGDEFVVLLPGMRAEEARPHAERLRTDVARLRCPVRGRPSVSIGVTLSLGIASAPEHGEDFETVFAAADRALYETKRRGRDGVAIAGVTAPAGEARLDLERFVGRAEETRRLVRLLDEANEGRPQIVALSGEAGVGKTTMLRQLAPEVRLRGGAIVTGRCLEADVKPPYGPWADVVESLRARGLVPEGRSWEELPRLVPALSGGASASRGEGSRYALYHEIAEYLRAAAEGCPLIIVLDDMQWADGATWDVLEYLVPQLANERLLVCLTIRAEDAAAAVSERRRRLSRDERFHEIALRRLSATDLSDWMSSVFHSDELAGELTPYLFQRTEGNPLLVVQVLRTLADDRAIWHDGRAWRWRPVNELRLPVAVSDLIARRLEKLTPDSRALLTGAAVLGRVWEVGLLIDTGAGTEDEVLDAVDDGVAASVLQVLDDGERYSFTHALLVDALLGGANPRRLRRAHEKAAAALEQRRPEAIDEIAAHYDRSGNAAQAYRYLMLAGARAMALYAHDEAASFYEAARRHAEAPEQQAEVRRRLVNVLEAAGRYADAEKLCEEVLADADEDPVRAIAARRQRERLRAAQDEPPQDTLASCGMLLLQSEKLGAEGEAIALLTMISQAHGRMGDSAAAEAIARDCVERASRTDDRRLLAESLVRLGTTLLERDPAESRASYARALEIFEQVADRRGQARCHMNSGIALSRTGDAADAEAAITRALELARSAHALDVAGLASLNLGVMGMKAGRFDVAAARFAEALRIFTQIHSAPLRLATLYNMAHLSRETNELVRAAERYAEAVATARSIGYSDVEIGATAGAGLVAVAAGDVDGARAQSEAVEQLVRGRGDAWFQGRELVEALRVHSALLEGHTVEAASVFEASVELAERHDVYGASWLVAECARALTDAGVAGLSAIIARHAPRADALGFAPLTARYADVRQGSRR